MKNWIVGLAVRFGAVLLTGVVLAGVSGCASAPPEELYTADITVEELETRLHKAMDPDGRYAKARSYIQQQSIMTERWMDDPEGTLVQVKYQRPDKLKMVTFVDNKPAFGMIMNGSSGWLIDYSADRFSKLNDEQFEQLKVLSAIADPDSKLTKVFEDIQISGCRIGDEDFYKLSCKVTKDDKDEPICIYVDKKDFLTKRMSANFVIKGQKLDYDSKVIRYELHDGVMIPAKTEVIQNGVREEITVDKYKLNIAIDPSEFLPPEY